MGVFDDDVAAALADIKQVDATEGIEVTIGTETVTGIRDLPEVEGFTEGGVTVKRSEKSVLIQKGGLTGLASDAAITVNGVAGTVHDSEPDDVDDRMTRIFYVES